MASPEEIRSQEVIAMARLAEDRRQFDEQMNRIWYPTLNDVTRPGAVSGLTGMLMDRPDIYGNYANLPTFGTISGSAGMMGRIGGGQGGPVDPRLAAMGYSADDLTLGGQQQRLGETTQQWRERVDARDFNAIRSDADRNYFEDQRRNFQDQTNKDTSLALEMNQDPNQVVGGRQLPAYLAKHSEWARNYAAGNNGQLPGYGELVKALAPFGQVPEDYNGGQSFPGQVPAAAPGIGFDPQHGWTDLVNGQNLDAQTVAQVAAERWQRAIPMRMNEQGQPIFSLPAGASMIGATVGPGGTVNIPSLDDGGRQQLMGAGQPMQQGGPAMRYTGPGMPGGGSGGFGGPGVQAGAPGQNLDYSGSGATGQIGQGRATSIDQRRLEEQGRQTDLEAQLTSNAQRITEKQVEYQNAVATGNLALANRAQTELTDLNNRKFGLEQRNQEFTEAFKAGELTGNYNGYDTLAKQELTERGRQFDTTTGENQRQFNIGQSGDIGGQDTLDKGALLGNFNGLSTLAGQEAYGGSGLVDTGLTLAAQQATGRVGGMNTLAQQELAGRLANGGATLSREAQEADIALRAAQTASQMRADPFALEVYRRGVSESGVPNIINAVAGRGQLGGVTGKAPALMTNANAAAPRTGLPSFGGAPPAARAPAPPRPFVPPPPAPPRRRAA